MKVQEWFISYLSWLRIAPQMRESFDCRKITMIKVMGPRVSYDVDGIKLLASFVDDKGTTDIDILEAGIPLNQDQGEIDWGAVVPQIILLAASLDFPEDLNMENLRTAGAIGKMACMKRGSLAIVPLPPVHLYTSDKYEYWLESKPNLDGKAIFHFIGKRRVLSQSAGVSMAEPAISVTINTDAIQKRAKEA